MFRQITLIFLLLITCKLTGQVNLVPNPSFETYDTCPNILEKIKFAVPWFQPNYPQGQYSSSTDYFNSCTSNWTCSVPNNLAGYQYARTGQAYVGYDLFEYPTDNSPREYAEVQLDSTLIAGNKYCVSFYVSLSAGGGFCTGTSAVGVYFSSDTCQYVSNTWGILPYTPQLINPQSNIITDTVGWQLVKWIYVAQGGERFITIGNFWDGSYNSLCSVPVCSGDGSYFYMDDVAIIPLPEINSGNDRTMIVGDTIQMSGSVSELWSGMQFEWLPHSGLSSPYNLNTTASPSVTTTYTLTVSCPTCDVVCLNDVMDSVTIFVEPISPPQTFSFHIPSLLYTDQVFFIDSLPTETRVKIYDMRGRIVFSSDDYGNNFYPVGLGGANYVYEVTLPDERVFKGKLCVIKR